MNLIIDVGNTLLKLAVFEADELLFIEKGYNNIAIIYWNYAFSCMMHLDVL